MGTNRFLSTHQVRSEAEYKLKQAANGRIMQHAHIGFRSVDRTTEAMARLSGSAADQGVTIDRFGITLDWTMGYPQDRRQNATRGTGIVLSGPEDFSRITNASPAAAHFGDFMLGLPGALENTRAAIAAGATAIGNLGQYFTFRLPHWDDDVATTEATVIALGLIAAQPEDILVHSNLDDGFAGLFLDVASAFGMLLIEKHIVEDLIGAKIAFCFGHHFSEPTTRAAFHAALAQVTETPGTMLFGNTVSYQGTPAANYASLSSYLLADILALKRSHTGHAINPVPVTENIRIPDVEEILDAQLFAHRLAELSEGYLPLLETVQIDALRDRLIAGGRYFADRALKGLADRGVDVSDPAALLLAIKRLGPKKMETLWGAAATSKDASAILPADWSRELDEMASQWVAQQGADSSHSFHGLKVILGTTDVHEHGAYLVQKALLALGVDVIDAGVAVDADELVRQALLSNADVIAVSTYNGVGLSYSKEILRELDQQNAALPVMIGGKLNEIPKVSNTNLPVDVSEDIRALGVTPCLSLDDMLPVLTACARKP